MQLTKLINTLDMFYRKINIVQVFTCELNFRLSFEFNLIR